MGSDGLVLSPLILVMVVLGAANCAAGAGAEGLLDSMTQGLDANKENRS